MKKIIIVTDKNIIENYEKEHTVKIGLVYDGLYSQMHIDLISDGDNYYTYERVAQKNSESAVVILPIYQEKVVLLRQYRHIIGDYQYAIPRGFGEKNLTALDNAKKELYEEIGTTNAEFTKLGNVIADSGLCGTNVTIFLANIKDYDITSMNEGIEGLEFLTMDEVKTWIKEGRISDGYTLSAFALCNQS